MKFPKRYPPNAPRKDPNTEYSDFRLLFGAKRIPIKLPIQRQVRLKNWRF